LCLARLHKPGILLDFSVAYPGLVLREWVKPARDKSTSRSSGRDRSRNPTLAYRL